MLSPFTQAGPEVLDATPGLMDEDGNGPFIPPEMPSLDALAAMSGDVSGYFDAQMLTALGQDVVTDYKRDKADRREWEEIAEEALKLAGQEWKGESKSYPWPNCANIRYPLLTTAALQFNARAYPAIVKGDEAISVKVVGKDRGRPAMGPDGQPIVQGPDGRQFPASVVPPDVAPMMQPVWIVPPGGKAARAARVADYLNTVLFYRMEDWEADTDTMLIQLPVVGCAFRKVWVDGRSGKLCAAMVPALRVVVPEGARSADTTPRLTEEIPDVYPHTIRANMRSGYYREVVLDLNDEEKAGARMLVEQHRLVDLDGDGLEEPYIVTVDLESEQVLRIEPNYSPDSIQRNGDGEAVGIMAGRFYVKYDFFPHPEGKFYGIGLGHLLKQIGGIIDSSLNQLMDAGTAQTAGGGFIASGVRLQGRSSVLRFVPGEYKTVEGATGSQLRDAIVERTLPQVSPVTFNVLDLIMGAAKDIAGIKDVITGEASNTGQVGTTLALIEQGLQVFNAIYKRVFRSLKAEFALLYRNVAQYGGEAAAKDYIEVLDDPQANFAADFNVRDYDIRPVSDPNAVTSMQKMAKAQALLGTAQFPGANPPALLKRFYEAIDVENPEELIVEPQPDPNAEIEAKATEAKGAKDAAAADKLNAETAILNDQRALAQQEAAYRAFSEGFKLAA